VLETKENTAVLSADTHVSGKSFKRISHSEITVKAFGTWLKTSFGLYGPGHESRSKKTEEKPETTTSSNPFGPAEYCHYKHPRSAEIWQSLQHFGLATWARGTIVSGFFMLGIWMRGILAWMAQLC
jgi:hypothetical protein